MTSTDTARLTDETLDMLKRDLRGHSFEGDGMTFVVAAFDHHTDDLHHVEVVASDRELARENDPNLSNTLLEHAIRGVLMKWRGGDA